MKQSRPRLVVVFAAAVFLALFIPQGFQMVQQGAIAVVPLAGRLVDGGKVLVTVRAYDSAHSEVDMQGCVQFDVEPSVVDRYGHGDSDYPGSGQICPKNSCCIVPTTSAVYLRKAKGHLEVSWGNGTEDIPVLVPAGRTLEVTVSIDRLDDNGYASEAVIYASDWTRTPTVRIHDVLVALQTALVMAALVSILLGYEWVIPGGLAFLAILPTAYLNNFDLPYVTGVQHLLLVVLVAAHAYSRPQSGKTGPN